MEKAEKKKAEIKLISLADIGERERKYITRLAQIGVSKKIIEDANIVVEEILTNEYEAKKWQSYVDCDPIPKPYKPMDIQGYFGKLRYLENESIERTIDWLLAVDECSILTQNPNRIDLSRRNLHETLRPNFGSEYEKYINGMLEILERIEDYLNDERLVLEATPTTFLEILNQKTIITEEIREFFDRYSYRILASQESYMDDVNPITSEYYYSAKRFKMHIWALRNVSIRFKYLEENYLTAKLHLLNVQIEIPKNRLFENLALRCLHTDFDHFSEYAISFDHNIMPSSEIFNAGIPDLYSCLINEWKMQMELTEHYREKMLWNRFEYEEKRRAVEESKSANIRELMKEKKIVPRSAKEPMQLPENYYPDIWNKFLHSEQHLYESFMYNTLHPRVFKLGEDEINLNKYILLGGIYHLHFVTRPEQVHFGKFNMGWHTNVGHLNVSLSSADDVLEETRLKLLQARMNTGSVKDVPSSEYSEWAEIAESAFIRDFEQSLYAITFELPKDLCLWDEPIPCYFESDVTDIVTTSETDFKSSDSGQHRSPSTHKKKTPEVHSKKNVLLTSRTDVQFEKANLPLRVRNMENRPENIYVSKVISVKEQARIREIFKPEIEVQDFTLEFPLTKTDVGLIQKYCIPRLLPSYRFALENYDAMDEEGTTTLLPRPTNEDIDAELDLPLGGIITFEHQKGPEHVYPRFSSIKKYTQKPNLLKELLKREPRTFFELLTAVDAIRDMYQSKSYILYQMPHFKPSSSSQRRLKRRGSNTLDKFQDQSNDSSIRSRTGRSLSFTDGIGTKRKSSQNTSDRASLRHASVKSDDISKRRESQKIHLWKSIDDSRERVKPEAVTTSQAVKASLVNYAHWTTAHIYKKTFDKEKSRLTIWTDRLGTISFAFKRYVHFPFKYWSVEPSPKNPEEVLVTILTKYVKCELYVGKEGYRADVTEIIDKYSTKIKHYLLIEEPIKDMRELKKRFIERNLNIFPNHDARFYIENEYFSEKHLATEFHTYCCMAINCHTIKFSRSQWNRLAQRRDIVLQFEHSKSRERDIILVHITPEGVTFVDIEELCTYNLEEIQLQYTLTWRNIEFFADLHAAISSVYSDAADNCARDAKLIHVKNLLTEIRPISFS